MRKLSSVILLLMSLGGWSQSLPEICSEGKFFCCERNGKEVEVVYPELILEDYTAENVQSYCEQKYGGSVTGSSTQDDENTVDLNLK